MKPRLKRGDPVTVLYMPHNRPVRATVVRRIKSGGPNCIEARAAGYSGSWHFSFRSENITWCRGWNTDEAKAFCVAVALSAEAA